MLIKIVTESLEALRWILAIFFRQHELKTSSFPLKSFEFIPKHNWKQNLTLQKLFQRIEVLIGGCPLVKKDTCGAYYNQEFIQDCTYTQTHLYVCVRNGRPN